jgi:hypothetical protein
MKVLVGCEYSGTVRDAFIALGWDALSCDLLPTEKPGPHYQGDVLDILHDGFDLAIFHPPCTYLASSGLHWNGRVEGRQDQTEAALAFVKTLLNADIPYIALENPVGCINTQIREASQIIQPYWFGEDASKATCLWLKGLPRLKATQRVNGRHVDCDGKRVERWDNQTDNGQNKLAPSEDRWKDRSRTYSGIAQAMAAQWTRHIEQELKQGWRGALPIPTYKLQKNATLFAMDG